MANPLQTIEEQAPPAYDKLVDVVWWRGVEPDPEDEFVRSLPDLNFRKKKKQGEKMIFFKKVPPTIRRMIYAYVFEYPANGKKVNLSKDFTTKDVFPPDFFIAPWDLLHQVEGGLSSCRQMRDELFTYFWNTYHFHVTFSPYSIGPVFSGLSIRLLNGYANRVNHLTVEVDLTKLAFSAAKDAKLLKQSNVKLQKVLVNLVNSLGRRRHKGNVMASLTLLARRYQGFRPAPADAPEDKEVPYCPENALYIFDCFCELRPLVLQCRMSGFSIPYSRQLLREILIKPFLTKPRPAPIIPAWPHYTPSPPEVVYLSNISTVATAGSSAGSTPGSIAESTTGSVDIPGFGTTIPSFGYSQASSSAGSLIHGTENTGFYKVQDLPSTVSLPSGSGFVRNTPSTSFLNSSFTNAQNAEWIGSNNPVRSSPPTSRSTPSSLATPQAGDFMTGDAGIPTTDGDSFTSTSRITVRSFGTPRAIMNTETGIPVPSRGTARSFRSRHGYMTDSSGIPITDSDDSAGLGLGISMGSYSSPSFSDEVDAEMARRHGAIPPPRSDSLPGVAKPPNTMNELNELNEQDPAFTRAVEGLRMATEDKEEGEEDGDDEGETVETGGSSKKDKKKGKGKKKKKGRKHWF